MFDDFKTIIDIPAFQEKLVKEFTTRSTIKIFRTKDIPQQKANKQNVNTGDVIEKKERSEENSS